MMKFLLTLLIFGLVTTELRAEPLVMNHRGISLIALPLPDGTFDISLNDREPTLSLISQALDEVYASSSFAAIKIEKLKVAGRVQIYYDASFPQLSLSNVTIAAFFPDFFKKGSNSKDFVVVVGRYGAKWNAKELAAVLVHELVGHGLQHLRGHTKFMRNLDLECEAYLYQEQYYQVAEFARASRLQVNFRSVLVNKWCSDFRGFMRKNHPEKMALWGPGPMQVPELLEVFEVYTRHLVKTGVAQKAIDRSKSARANQFAAFKARAEQSGDADKLFQVGLRYFRGVGVETDKQEGLSWIRRAAQKGHARAQGVMGRLSETGKFGRVDPIEAYKWYTLAVDRGLDKVAPDLQRVSDGMTLSELTEAQARVEAFRSLNQ